MSKKAKATTGGNRALMEARVARTGAGVHGDRRTRRNRDRAAQRRTAIREFD